MRLQRGTHNSIYIYTYTCVEANWPHWRCFRPPCQFANKRLLANWHSGLKHRQCGQLASTKHRLSGRRSPDCRRVHHLRPTRSRTPESRCFVEASWPHWRCFRPLCQFANKRLLANWHSGLKHRQCGQFASTTCVSIYLSMYLSICLSIHLSIRIYNYICVYIYLSIHLPIWIYIYVCIYCARWKLRTGQHVRLR